ncbi:GMC family oxidoreductase N-terminal domain-containing protein [Paraburkholderia silviterrae]|uniref:Uncharacterized protein n=1 Tax=Paraburkholderia silviterrae TaxID=2528715 RepID=A0A4R5M2E2_9BURK|nr:GMC family oxidoreductase N-terminal domain-containing protein [Paraburkholderia silviterrae]TDG19667.1 hypothetical protein EYW47_29285 [Paraburkholderia silviterrae]
MSEVIDYIVVGGGSGDCVIAGRMSEDPNLAVCVLEAGGRGTLPVGAARAKQMATAIHDFSVDVALEGATPSHSKTSANLGI